MFRIIPLIGVVLLTPSVQELRASREEQANDKTPTCEMVARTPAKYVGQTVRFFATLRSFEAIRSNKTQDSLSAWLCKDSRGRSLNVVFGFRDSHAQWTREALGVEAYKELFIVSGVVSDVEVFRDKEIPTLKSVSVALAAASGKVRKDQ